MPRQIRGNHNIIKAGAVLVLNLSRYQNAITKVNLMKVRLQEKVPTLTKVLHQEVTSILITPQIKESACQIISLKNLTKNIDHQATSTADTHLSLKMKDKKRKTLFRLYACVVDPTRIKTWFCVRSFFSLKLTKDGVWYENQGALLVKFVFKITTDFLVWNLQCAQPKDAAKIHTHCFTGAHLLGYFFFPFESQLRLLLWQNLISFSLLPNLSEKIQGEFVFVATMEPTHWMSVTNSLI